MPRIGLNRQAVVSAAIELIEDEGCQDFSMRELADRLQVKTASLYNHIESIDSLYGEIGSYVISKLMEVQLSAVGGKRRDEAVRSLALAHYGFAKEHPELYRVFMNLPALKNDNLFNEAGDTVNLIIDVLSGYRLDEKQKMHLQRVLRSIIQGFIVQEDIGCLRHFPVDASDSFNIAIDCFLEGLHNMEN